MRCGYAICDGLRVLNTSMAVGATLLLVLIERSHRCLCGPRACTRNKGSGVGKCVPPTFTGCESESCQYTRGMLQLEVNTPRPDGLIRPPNQSPGDVRSSAPRDNLGT